MISAILSKIKRRILSWTGMVPVQSSYEYPGIEYVEMNNSIIMQGMNVKCMKPVVGKKYVHIGNDSMVSGVFVFESESGEVIIGDKTYIGGANIYSRSKIEFGNNIFVAWRTYFYDHDSHSLDFRERQNDIDQQLKDIRTGQPNFIFSKNWDVVRSKPIKICDNAWIGMESIILKGVTIGEGAIVGAGSVVREDVPPWTIVAGNPAVVIKELPKELRREDA